MDADQLLQIYAVQVAGEMGTNETTSTSQLMEYGCSTRGIQASILNNTRRWA